MIWPVTRPGSVITNAIAWTVGAVVSVGVGLLSLSLIGVRLTSDSGQHLADPASRTDEPAAVTTTPATTPSSTSPAVTGSPPAATATGPNRTINTAGGDVVARCVPGGAYLVYWIPAPGFRADDVSRGPAAQARVTFQGNGREINVRVTCVNLIATPSIEDEPDHHG